MIVWAGDLEETCAECRSLPASCECEPLADSARTRDGLAALAARYAPVDWDAAWKGQPASVEWLIEPFLEQGTINVLFAKAGTGKSLLALEWALMLVRDECTVVYIDDENRVSDIVERLQAFGATPDELGRLLLYSFAGLPPLDTSAGGLHLLALAAEADAAMVVLDTTTRMVVGKENDSDTFLQLFRCSLVPLKKRGITVVRLDHPGKDADRGQRGSSAKDGDADTIWKLTELAKGRRFRMHRDKNRTGHAPDYEDVDVERQFAPLRHSWAVRDRSPEKAAIGQLCGQLDALGVPPSAGRDRCRTALVEAGIKASNDLLSKAVNQRRYAPDSSRTAGQPVLPLPPVRAAPTHGVWGGGQVSRHPSSDSAEPWPDGSTGEAVSP
jgi:AAA domain